MSIQGLGNNSLFNLNNIRTLAGSSGSASTSGSGGGVFSLGGNGGGGSSTAGNGNATSNDVGDGNLGLGDVNSKDGNVSDALNSVAGESALQQQFKNQLSLINLQERIQTQSRTVEILTNILKSRHDAALSAARNVK